MSAISHSALYVFWYLGLLKILFSSLLAISGNLCFRFTFLLPFPVKVSLLLQSLHYPRITFSAPPVWYRQCRRYSMWATLGSLPILDNSPVRVRRCGCRNQTNKPSIHRFRCLGRLSFTESSVEIVGSVEYVSAASGMESSGLARIAR